MITKNNPTCLAGYSHSHFVPHIVITGHRRSINRSHKENYYTILSLSAIVAEEDKAYKKKIILLGMAGSIAALILAMLPFS